MGGVVSVIEHGSPRSPRFRQRPHSPPGQFPHSPHLSLTLLAWRRSLSRAAFVSGSTSSSSADEQLRTLQVSYIAGFVRIFCISCLWGEWDTNAQCKICFNPLAGRIANIFVFTLLTSPIWNGSK